MSVDNSSASSVSSDPAVPSQAPAGIRPKAYRRPPHWVGPPSSPDPLPPHTAPRTELAPMSEPKRAEHHKNEPTFGLALLTIVLLANLIFAFSLNHLDEYTTRGNVGDLRDQRRLSPAPAVTLFTVPVAERRSALPVMDATDSITSFRQHSDARTESE